jgi:hypothetical protein
MALTTDQIISLDFGYLTGVDLLQYCSSSLLAAQYEKNPDSFQSGCDQAYMDMKSILSTRYDIDAEFENTEGNREALFVKIVSLKAIENILGNLPDLSLRTKDLILWANDIISAIRNRQRNLDLFVASDSIVSDSAIIEQSLNHLG